MAKSFKADYNLGEATKGSTVIRPVILKLPPAHPLQYELITALDRYPYLRFIVGACGTKFGKTFGTSIAMVKQAWNHKDSLNWWVSPTYSQAENAYSLIKRMMPEGSYKPHDGDIKLEIMTPDNKLHSTIEFKSAEDPDNLRGFGVHFFVMDEAARCRYESYISLLTTVTQTFGRGYFISTPKGRGWFYDIYQLGEKFDANGQPLYKEGEDEYPEWLSIRMPTWANPHVKPQAIEDLRKNMPEDVFRQEVGAQFLSGSAGVFRGIRECIKGKLEKPSPARRYVMGVDLARIEDFTVIVIIDQTTRQVVYFDRFNQLSWRVQYNKIIEAARAYNNALVYMDGTGLGDPIVEEIQSAGVRVVPFKISPKSKQPLIDALRLNMEQGNISYPEIPMLLKELEVYEYSVTNSGNITFSAPSGKKDDCVIALALANQGIDQEPWVYRYTKQRGI